MNRRFAAISGALFPAINVGALWLSLSLGGSEVHQFGWRFIHVAVPVNVVAVLLAAWLRRERWYWVGAGVVIDAASTLLLLYVSLMFWLMLHAGGFS